MQNEVKKSLDEIPSETVNAENAPLDAIPSETVDEENRTTEQEKKPALTDITPSLKPEGETAQVGKSLKSDGRLFAVRVAAVAVAVVGLVLLALGIALRGLDEKSKVTPHIAQMPEEYIEEFFSGDEKTPQIEDYIEPEA